MSGISTHILDTASGKPAAGIVVRLYNGPNEIAVKTTDADGRCPSLLSSGAMLQPGVYSLLFEVGSYFPHSFFPEVTVHFRVTDPEACYHIPLLISPFGYSTYRGS
jgi:5-hydroxyisourate hydrolase